MRVRRRRASVATRWLAPIVMVGASVVPAQPQTTAAPLAVPFVAQTEALCGGASAAMVLRYWGTRSVSAADFAPLVREDRAGIPTAALVQSLTARGWLALPFTGDAAVVQHHLARGRPVIALIQARPGALHYVVVVGWGAAGVLLHDPAVGPARHMPSDAFIKAWNVTSRWTLLLLPDAEHAPPGHSAAPIKAADATPAPSSCAAALARAAGAAEIRDFTGAERELLEAGRSCPDDSAPLREMSALRLLQSRPDEAVVLARQAVARRPSDRQAVRVLATALFLADQRAAALRTWNVLREPVVDLIALDGLTRTRTPVGLAALQFASGKVLTPGAIARARHRLRDFPAVRTSRVDYTPVSDGLANIDAAAVERPLFPSGPAALIRAAADAVVDHEARVEIASPTGGGEQVSASWRWWARRPRVRVGVAVPLVSGPVRGVLKLDGVVETQSYAPLTPGAAELESHRRSATASLSDWTGTGLRWQLQAGLDRWQDRGSKPQLGGALEQRLFRDHGAIEAAVDVWPGSGGFSVSRLGIAGRLGGAEATELIGEITGITASTYAPPDLWPGAGTGPGRPLLLRAHSLLDDGVVRSEAFGRTLVQGTVEGRRAMTMAGPVRVSAAVFVDAARAWRGPLAHRMLADVGVGVRFRLPGEGTLRVDFAHSITDGSRALSAGWDLLGGRR